MDCKCLDTELKLFQPKNNNFEMKIQKTFSFRIKVRKTKSKEQLQLFFVSLK